MLSLAQAGDGEALHLVMLAPVQDDESAEELQLMSDVEPGAQVCDATALRVSKALSARPIQQSSL